MHFRAVMLLSSKYIWANYRHTFNSSLNIRVNEIPPDYYEAKEVDRKLSYFLVRSDSIVCDVGGASGVDAFPIAMLGSFCISLDINRDAAKIGKLSLKKSLKSKIDFVVASATNLPFKDCSLDLVTCFSVLDHLPTKDDVRLSIHEFSRVIKDFGFVAITVPNRLFLIGNLSMRLKRLLETDALFERRFTPKEMREIIIQSGLTPIAFGSKYPTRIGATFMKYNLPKIVSKFPRCLISSVFTITESLFQRIEKITWLRLFGARFGYLSQKQMRL
jgi:ubiquinone/menaquinone biosynthesis C-methylase UbiE